MAQKITASMPENLDLESGWQINIVAIDATTGDEVTGVTFSNMALIVDQVSGNDASALAVGPFQLIPLQELNS